MSDLSMMGEEKALKTEIERKGEKIVLPAIPTPMSYGMARKVLAAQEKADEEVIFLTRTYECMPWDGAIALTKALAKKFGWIHTKPTPGFFGSNPPQFREVPIGPNGEVTQVIWGTMGIMSLDEAEVSCGATYNSGALRFVVNANVKRKFQGQMTDLFDLVTQIVREESIYKGKAFNINVDSDGDLEINTPPSFMDTSKTKVNELIFSKSLEADLAANLFTPICLSQQCRDAGIPLKRGILLEGPYGVGKSMTAAVTAKLCEENGWTFINVARAGGLAAVFKWARMFAPVVVFCEDIDRSMEGERTDAKDAILNIVDGVQHKNEEIILVLTTNHVEKINRAMLRPGRFDAVISVGAPDAEAAERLVRLYARDNMRENEDLTEAGKLMAGQIPAVIAEVTKRATLFAIANSRGEDVKITQDAIVLSAESMKRHLDLLNKKEQAPTEPEKLFSAMQTMVDKALETNKRFENVEDLVESISNNM